MTYQSLIIQVFPYLLSLSNFILIGRTEILVQNAGMDATTQFEDIHHSKKADEFMKELYIGDFYNPDAEKESWEDYVRRK
jgi:cytochrome b involved in lipid metabolism